MMIWFIRSFFKVSRCDGEILNDDDDDDSPVDKDRTRVTVKLFFFK